MVENESAPLSYKEHHESGQASQRRFHRQVHSLVDTITEMGNPFLRRFPELVRIDTNDVVDTAVANTFRTMRVKGGEQYKNFYQTVLVDRSTPIMQPIKRNSVPLFSTPPVKEPSKKAREMAMMKMMYICLGVRLWQHNDVKGIWMIFLPMKTNAVLLHWLTTIN
eukprot:Lithocolla_globosa_v1_NODE_1137_length_2843_cov_20.852941.p1 type:complete len:165 gc:universal NODE_1137_length_2843_cov_20.852941:2096-2590(+)